MRRCKAALTAVLCAAGPVVARTSVTECSVRGPFPYGELRILTLFTELFTLVVVSNTTKLLKNSNEHLTPDT